jgi:hypothetical protein
LFLGSVADIRDELPVLSAAESAAPALARQLLRAPIEPLAASSFPGG